MHDIVSWLTKTFDFSPSVASDALYDQMPSQSGYCLPVIYQPFDARLRSHIVDCGQILDYVISTGPGHVLDFGPGDGWPSLSMAPLVRRVTGVDASLRRIRVCRNNARRLGIGNTRFLHVPPTLPLPFPPDTFDGITAASSLEQTPDVSFTVRELHRVLKPGGRLRMHYEALTIYNSCRLVDMELIPVNAGNTMMVIYIRDIAGETVTHYGFTFRCPMIDMTTHMNACQSAAPGSRARHLIQTLHRNILRTESWKTRHPSPDTWLTILHACGFQSAGTFHNGGTAARIAHDTGRLNACPDRNSLLTQLHPLVETAIQLEAPPFSRLEPCGSMITAVK